MQHLIHKHLLRPQRLRLIPPSFSWGDHRLVRPEYLARADHHAWTLYLFLVPVADAQGLSFYADAGLCRRLTPDPVTLWAARQQLVQAARIAYRKPLDQGVALPEAPTPALAPSAPRTGEAPSVAALCAARWKEAASDR